MREHTIKTYSLKELSATAQDEALNNHINFLLECVPFEQQSEAVQKAIKAADDMRTPWFAGQYVYEYAKDEIVADLEENEYEFYADGSLFNFKGMG